MHRGHERGSVNVGMLCQTVGMSRQNYYKQRTARRKQAVDEELVLSLVREERKLQPRLGTRKLICLLKGHFQSAGMQLGRDRMFRLLRGHQLLQKRKRRGARTTYSRHHFAVYGNLAKDLAVNGPHQLLVSDITYVRTEEGFMYLSLVMDGYSRKIVGYDSSDNLEMEGALRALRMALKQMPSAREAVHHSDRGSQYCCHVYIEQLRQAGMRISMTEENHCYENGKAERLNGIFKGEYGLGATLASKEEARLTIRQAVELYNHRRPHLALGYRIPQQVHMSLAA